ncbi:GNAT family N-acetyltransferase [Actinomadura parmotrematis]|uniref:N-acetyltransferase n=1 Tax=Actinomadura parmotrematis TaxID=2864039 RepID=A0ABS7FVR0_9ACTN|nr:GNAT family N-acetyltransferase [Actinomadura parmotrematis]MBW8484514.1 N-acetyltransferase [Actinomadura parmotrematis]
MSREITDNAAANRYEIREDGALAGFAEYVLRDGEIVFTHTEVDPSFEGKGVGGALARGALDDVRTRDLAVVPQCPFIKSWIDKHPDYRDLVAS